MSNETSKISELDSATRIKENALIPVVNTNTETNNIDLSTLRSALWFENAYADVASGLAGTEKNESFFAYEDETKTTVLGWVNQGGDSYSPLLDSNNNQVTYLTATTISNIAEGKIPLPNGGFIGDLQSYLSFDMFGIDKTGTVDVTNKIKAVFLLAAALKLSIKQNNGTYLISGNDKLVFYTDYADFDLSGATIILGTGYTGTFWFTQKNATVVYDATSALVSTINANAARDLVAGSNTLDSLAADTTLNGSMVLIEFTDDLYTYNTSGTAAGAAVQKYMHLTRVSANGRMDHSLPYNATAVSKITVLPVADRKCTIKHPNVDYRNKPFPIMFQHFYVTNIKIFGGKVINKPITDVGNRHVSDIQYGIFIEADSFYDAYPSSTFSNVGMTATTASYTFHHAWTCYLTVRNVNCFGYGWGAISAAGYITDTTFINCTSNNYDSHNPIIGYYRLIDCTVGDAGVVTFGVKNSTVELIRVTFELGKGLGEPYKGRIYFPSLLQARTSSGGITDSKLIMRDVKVNGRWPNYVSATDGRAGIVQGYADPYTALPTNSPMGTSPFKEIDIDGFTITDPVTANILINPVFSNKPDQVNHPSYLRMANVTYADGGMIKFNMINFLNSPKAVSNTADPNIEPVDIRIDLENISVSNLVFQAAGTGYAHNLRVSGRRIRNKNTNITPTLLRISQRGVYNFDDCEFSQIITNDGGTEASTRVEVNMVGGSVVSGSNIPYVTSNSNFIHRFNATRVSFVGNYSLSTVTQSNTTLAQWAKMSNCTFFDATTGGVVSNLLVWSGATTAGINTVSLYIAKGNTVTTASTQGANTLIDTFTLNYPGSGRFSRTVSSSTASSENTLSGSASVTVGGTAGTGTTSTPMNVFANYFQIGTRDAQAYITGIYSQLVMSAIYVG